MYVVFIYIHHKDQPNLGKYTIPESYTGIILIIYVYIYNIFHLPHFRKKGGKQPSVTTTSGVRESRRSWAVKLPLSCSLLGEFQLATAARLP